jgi:starch synthase
LGVEDKFAYLFDFFGEANITKASILCSDKIVAVSETYKEEIQQTEKGSGLQNVLEQCNYKLFGITNGIDYEFYNPSTDPTIYQTFNEESLELRKQNKLKIQEELGLPVDENIPLYAYVGFMAEHKGFDLISQSIEEFVSRGIQLVAVGTVSPDYEEYIRSLNEKYPNNIKINIGYGGHLAKKLYASSDFLLNPASIEPCGLCPLIANRYGSLPICYETGGIKDNIIDYKYPNGNGYLFNDYDKNTLLDLIDKTLHDFQNKEKMKQYILSGMSKKFDIIDCANQYLKLYEEM